MDLKIRPETLADHQEVYALHKMAFGQEEESILVDNLRESEAFIPDLALVAVLEYSLVGHILFTNIKIVDDALNQVPPPHWHRWRCFPSFKGGGVESAFKKAWKSQES